MTMHEQYLQYLAYRGAVDRYGVAPDIFEQCLRDAVAERLDYELSVIGEAGYSAYFLIVADLLRYCREAGIPTGPGRGSVCGSAVAYAIGITDVDPLRWNIPFERFLHLERIAMPDIDLDVCQVRRQEVIEYLRETYGRDTVAQIMTFGTMMARGVVRDVCRVLHVDETLHGVRSNETGDALAQLIPEGSGPDQARLDTVLGENEEFRNRISALDVPYNGVEVSVLDTCRKLEGVRRHSSVHAAGVVIADRPLIDLVPLSKKNKGAEVQIQFDMADAEAIGLLKFDILGLRTVTVIGETEAAVRHRLPSFAIKDVPLDDAATYALLAAGDTGGVFQMEGEGITNALRGVAPDRFDDIVALLALYRPGPMEQLSGYIRRKHGTEAVSYDHPDLEPVLSTTYGLIVYQEQVMGMSRVLAGYSAGEADMFRKAIGKKLPELLRTEIARFVERATARGHDPHVIESIGKQIAAHGRYSFGLGHSVGYAYISYWTAYLKANHPTEFYAALLNSYMGDQTRLGQALREARGRGLDVRVPDINISGREFTAEKEGTIRFGLSAVLGLGDSAIQDILEERDSTEKNRYGTQRVVRVRDNGEEYKASIRTTQRVANVPAPYADAWGFCQRLPHIPVNVKQNLVVAGAFGADPEYRGRLYDAMPDLNKRAKAGKAFCLDTCPAGTLSDLEMARLERKAVGFYVSGHPLDAFGELLDMYGAYSEGEWEQLPHTCSIAGLVVGCRTHQSKNGEMAWVTLENAIQDMPQITVFADLWSGAKSSIQTDAVISVHGTREEHARYGTSFRAQSVRVLDRSRPQAQAVQVAIPVDSLDLDAIDSLLTGTGPLWEVVLIDGDRGVVLGTQRRGPITGAILSTLISRGWEVALDRLDHPVRYGDGLWACALAAPSVGNTDAEERALARLGGDIYTQLRRIDAG